MTIQDIVEAMRRQTPNHTLGGASQAPELDALEQRLGHPLPAPYREFLEQIGSGIFYQRHEIFGPRRVMLHDIEFVPDLMSVHSRLLAEGREPPEGRVPVHRVGRELHLLDLNPGAGHGCVVTEGGDRSYPDFGRFLEAVVLPEDAKSS